MRDRLIELLKGAEGKVTETLSVALPLDEWLGIYADHLLANGVIVPPCKVGDTVYVIFSQFRNEIAKCRIDEFCIQEDGKWAVADIHYPNFVAKRNAAIPFWWFGRFAFLTREEAERALKEGDWK